MQLPADHDLGDANMFVDNLSVGLTFPGGDATKPPRFDTSLRVRPGAPLENFFAHCDNLGRPDAKSLIDPFREALTVYAQSFYHLHAHEREAPDEPRPAPPGNGTASRRSTTAGRAPGWIPTCATS